MARPDEPSPEDPRFVLPRRRLGSLHTIETVLLASTACLLAAVAWPIATGQIGGQPGGPSADEPAASVEPAAAAPMIPAAPIDGPTIQLALVLDTSGSMDGLIDQARSRLWNVVNALDSATFHGDRPRLEVAVYEYGNDAIAREAGHIRRVVGFTSELDEVSRALFSLSTNGGSEHAPEVIVRAADELEWRNGPGVLRVMYVAGNESFQQGPVAWTTAMDAASARGVVVNTVYCGSMGDIDAPLWQAAAARGRGLHFKIDHNARAMDPTTPFDQEIGELGVAINGTYVGYGAKGRDGIDNQQAQDDNSLKSGSLVNRGLSKSGASYTNPSWDLVDAVNEGIVDLEAMPADALPAEIAELGADERAAFVEARRVEREAITTRLGELRGKREAFLVDARADGDQPESLDEAMVEAITEQAHRVGFTL